MFQGECGSPERLPRRRACACSASSSAKAAAASSSSLAPASAGNSSARLRSIRPVSRSADENALLAHRAREELDVGLRRRRSRPGQRGAHAAERDRAVLAPDDQLGDHRVVVRRDLVALARTPVSTRTLPAVRPAGTRDARSVRWRAGSPWPDPRRRCAPRWRGRCIARSLLLQRQRFAGGDAQLPLHEVEAGDHLGHRVLDLQARVHLHEVERAVLLGDELHRAGAGVADRLAPRRPRPRPSALRRSGVRPGRRRLLQHLLVAALHRAVALEEVDDVAVRVAEHLHFDVARPVEVSSRSARGRRRRRISPRAARASSAAAKALPLARRCACPCRRRRPRP